jgi:carbamoyltransferase
MIILGLCVAHDAGIAVLEDGHVKALVSRERWTRRKRCALITADFLIETLNRLGLGWADVDRVAIAASQSWPFLFLDQERFRFDYDIEQIAAFPIAEAAAGPMQQATVEHAQARRRVREKLALIQQGQFGEYFHDDVSGLDPEQDALWCREWAYSPQWWKSSPARGALAQWCAKIPSLSGISQGYLPIRVTLEGVPKPGLVVPHHLAHAAYGFYQSDSDEAAILTADNGDTYNPLTGYVGGIYAKGIGNRVIPIGPTYAVHAHAYQRVAEILKLGEGGGAGKLMGLAPYGRPRFADRTMIGDAFTLFGETYALHTKNERNQVIGPLVNRIKSYTNLIYDQVRLLPDGTLDLAVGWRTDDLQQICADLAASTQWIFEESALEEVRRLSDALLDARQWTGKLCLSGGAALNCPANTRIHGEGPFRTVSVPPAVDDSGLPLGAAQAVAHNVLDLPRETAGIDRCDSAYLGFAYTRADLDAALASRRDTVLVNDGLDAPADAARIVADDKVIAWFEGRSEIGPRALGHRSIVSDPRRAANWRRVNDIKQRETWRPFAPAVLKDKAGDWFDGGPSNSPHMLFTATVTSTDLPAITHVDGSARIQTVGSDCGGFRTLIEAFEAETGVPVVMNTSFNGPGEPIVETPEQAVDFLVNNGIDAVYVDGVKLTSAACRST